MPRPTKKRKHIDTMTAIRRSNQEKQKAEAEARKAEEEAHLIQQIRSMGKSKVLEILDPEPYGEPKALDRIEKKRSQLVDNINQLPKDHVESAYTAISVMKYNTGAHEGQMLSPYLVKKARTLLEESIYKPLSLTTDLKSEVKDLKWKNTKLEKETEKLKAKVRSLTAKCSRDEVKQKSLVSTIRSLVSRRKSVSQKQFVKEVQKHFKKNKQEYTPDFLKLAADISNMGTISISSTIECTKALYIFLTGEIPERWISVNTLSRWNKDVDQSTIGNSCSAGYKN